MAWATLLSITLSVWFSTSSCAVEPSNANLIRARFLSKEDVYCLAFCPDGTTLASGGSDHDAQGFIVTLWDLKRGKRRSAISTRLQTQLQSLSFSPSGELLVATDYPGSEHCIIPASGKGDQLVFRQFENLPASIRYCSFLNDREIATISNHNLASVWNVKSRVSRYYYLWNRALLVGAATMTKDRKVVVWTDRFGIYTWPQGLVDGAETSIRKIKIENKFERIVLDASGRRLLACAENELTLVDLTAGKIQRKMAGHAGYVFALLPLEKKKAFISGDSRGIIRVWDWNGEPVMTKQSGQQSIMCLAVDRDETVLASAGEGSDILLWDLNALLSGKNDK